jgi:hypothetical protein
MACRPDESSCTAARACSGAGWGRTPEAEADQVRAGPPQMVHQPCRRTQGALTPLQHAGDPRKCAACARRMRCSRRRCAQLPSEQVTGTPAGCQRMSHVKSKRACAPAHRPQLAAQLHCQPAHTGAGRMVTPAAACQAREPPSAAGSALPV